MKSSSITHSLHVAIEGISHAVKENRNLKIHLIFAVLVMVLAALLGLKREEAIGVMVMVVLVISAEMINTSLEEMTNLITNEHRREAKIAKDVAAGMVLVISVGAAIVGVYIFYPYIF